MSKIVLEVDMVLERMRHEYAATGLGNYTVANVFIGIRDNAGFLKEIEKGSSVNFSVWSRMASTVPLADDGFSSSVEMYSNISSRSRFASGE